MPLIKYKFRFWHYGLFITTLLSSVLAYNLIYGDKKLYISGPPTHGHHQIEMSCNSCHDEAFAGREKMQQACESCHLDALKKTRDTHPQSKFTDPRNAELILNLDATQCVTCHREHKPEITRDYGVTLAKDFCSHCHQEIAEDRPSHKQFEFDSCTSSGCHKYHDNSALYENFLRKHLKDKTMAKRPRVPERTALARWLKKNKDTVPLQIQDQNGAALNPSDKVIADWQLSSHAQVAVNCLDCHQQNDKLLALDSNQLKTQSCSDCHDKTMQSFTEGKHGMRLSPMLKNVLPPMSPSQALLPMQAKAHDTQLSCVSCHDPHKPDMVRAATQACLGCHQDEHSVNFEDSPHGKLQQDPTSSKNKLASSVTCATCHMPRHKKGSKVFVDHNQNATLEPNSKMLRPVCLNCHGMEFSLVALADKALIKSNFNGTPVLPHLSFDLVREREAQREKLRQQKNNSQQ